MQNYVMLNAVVHELSIVLTNKSLTVAKTNVAVAKI